MTRVRRTAQATFCFLFVMLAVTRARAANPVPFINNPLVPSSVAPGNGALTLTVNGGGFVSGATVNWNGTPLATTFVSNTKLTAAVPAADTQNAGSAEITVTNPGTGATSNMIQFLVAAAGPSMFYVNAPNSPYGNYLSPEGLWNFTNDGKLDLLVLSLVPQYSGLMAGAGNATFGALRAPLPTAYTAWFVGDFNDDGRLDLIAAPVSGSEQVFWGNDDGTFSLGPVVTAPAGWGLIGNHGSNGISGMSATDFNGDGNLDLLLENAKTGQVQTLLGNGDGTFSAGPIAALPQGFDVEGSADFNGDGAPDLLLEEVGSSTSAACQFSVLLGNGEGTFSPAPAAPTTVAACANASPAAIADVNGDGTLDLAVPDGLNGAPTNSGGVNSPPVAVLLGKGDGTFTRVPNCCGTPGLQAHNVVAADLNNDGKLDLAVSIANNPGSFQASLQGAPPVYIEALLGKGDGTFQSTDYSMLLPSSPSLSGGDGTMGLYAADLNGDGKLDFVTGDIFNYGAAGYEISVLTQTPPPAQSPDFTIAPANASVSVKAGDTATDNIQIASVNGFLSGGVSLAIAGCPATVTCNVSQPQGAIIPSSTGSFPLTIATQACTTASALPTSPPFLRLLTRGWILFAWFALALILMWTAIIPQRRKARLGDHVSRRGRLLPWVAVALAGVAIGGCNASSTPSQKTPSCVGGTPAGTYTINVSAASDAITHSTTVALAVQ